MSVPEKKEENNRLAIEVSKIKKKIGKSASTISNTPTQLEVCCKKPP